jgi:hypothetical protein
MKHMSNIAYRWIHLQNDEPKCVVISVQDNYTNVDDGDVEDNPFDIFKNPKAPSADRKIQKN